MDTIIGFKPGDIKLESSEAYLLKLGKNLWWDFEFIYNAFFVKIRF